MMGTGIQIYIGTASRKLLMCADLLLGSGVHGHLFLGRMLSHFLGAQPKPPICTIAGIIYTANITHSIQSGIGCWFL